jgi:hypothetical protein
MNSDKTKTKRNSQSYLEKIIFREKMKVKMNTKKQWKIEEILNLFFSPFEYL